MHASTGLQVIPAPNGFGAEVRGLDLSQTLPHALLAAVRRAWIDHRVLWFPDQPLTLDELERFTLQFGEFGLDPFIDPMPGHPNVLELRREPDEKVSNFGAAWHSDWSFQATPPSATILHSQVVPPVGGDTLFADACAAYDALDDAMKRRLAGLSCAHCAGLAYGPRGVYAQDHEQRSMTIRISEEAEALQVHPLVRTHPESGRKALYVNPVYTYYVVGLPEQDSRQLLGELYGHMLQERFIYRHRWQRDMLVMWDNRCTMHYADGGYDGYLRVMHRTTVKGERPQA